MPDIYKKLVTKEKLDSIRNKFIVRDGILFRVLIKTNDWRLLIVIPPTAFKVI